MGRDRGISDNILDWLPYSSPDLCWGLGVVLIRSLLVHTYNGVDYNLSADLGLLGMSQMPLFFDFDGPGPSQP